VTRREGELLAAIADALRPYALTSVTLSKDAPTRRARVTLAEMIDDLRPVCENFRVEFEDLTAFRSNKEARNNLRVIRNHGRKFAFSVDKEPDNGEYRKRLNKLAKQYGLTFGSELVALIFKIADLAEGIETNDLRPDAKQCCALQARQLMSYCTEAPVQTPDSRYPIIAGLLWEFYTGEKDVDLTHMCRKVLEAER
jgi:hypothetical protein